MVVKAIETRYAGYRFRSRLEARWAVFLDAVGIKWEYESEGYNISDARPDASDPWYLPDFYVPNFPFMYGFEGAFLEIKPARPLTEREYIKASGLAAMFAGLREVIVVHGTPGDASFMAIHCEAGCGWRDAKYSTLRVGVQYGGDKIIVVPFETGMLNPETGVVDFRPTKFQDGTAEDIWNKYADEYALSNVVAAARSARFEHGERGGK